MASMPTKQCNHPGCRHLQPCPIHPKKAWVHNKPVTRIRGRALQRARELLFAEQPLCVICLAHGIERAATVRDHIIPLAEGGEDIRDNTQALCKQCNDTKGLQEAKRGRHGNT
jgi:5-methylcytosine-specific restriction protein A